MKILFEGYQYKTEDVKDALQGLLSDNDLNQPSQQLKYVGYYYNKCVDNTYDAKGDLVFILPKVLLDKDQKAFGLDPNELINFNLKQWDTEKNVIEGGNLTKKKVHDFVYGFATWIYRAIDIYRKNRAINPNPVKDDEDGAGVDIRSSLQIGKGGKTSNVTYFDILLSLVDFQRQHRNFITFIIKMSHSGFNKISWPKTIAQTQAVVQDESPVYLNPINKQRVINFDEELLIIYFSILDYIHEEFGCHILNQPGYKLIKGAKFDSYLKGQGKARLHKIRYKYYSDEAILLWNLCYDFFNKSDELRTQANGSDYLLVNKFEVVFEAMIDELLGDKDLPADLKRQHDDKRIDHLYTYKYLIENLDNNNDVMLRDIYNIADSKYYRRDKELRGHDIPKQFTYARNVIQWQMDLIHGIFDERYKNDTAKIKKAEPYKKINLYDPITEGYNIIPNFFISGFVEDDLNYEDGELKFSTLKDTENPQESFFYWERLFDRDTLFTLHYDVNFLYVLKMYAQNKSGAKAAWKEESRQKFRTKMLEILNDNFKFYQVLIPTDTIESFVEKHFRKIIGKVFSFNDADGNRVLLYAERKHQNKGKSKGFEYNDETSTHIVDKNTLYIPSNEGETYKVVKVKLSRTKYIDTNYALVGYYRDQKHINWILENGIYNIPTTLRGKDHKLDKGLKLPAYIILHNEELGNYIFNVFGAPIKIIKREDLPKGEYEPSRPEYYIFKINVSQSNDEVLKVVAESTHFRKKMLNKKPFAINLCKLKELKTREESKPLADIKPIDALRYELEKEEVFYSLVAEPEAEYGNQ